MYPPGFTRFNALLSAGLILIIAGISSCKKEGNGSNYGSADPEIISMVFNQGAVSTRNTEKKEISVAIADYINRKNLVAIFQLTDGATATVNGVEQHSSDTPNDFTLPVTYVISKKGRSSSWKVTMVNNNYEIGLGSVVTADKRLERDYEWYQSQDTSGALTSPINGGPACLAMALNWASRLEFTGITTQSIRGVEAKTSNMYTSLSIMEELNRKGVSWKIVSLTPDYSEITSAIDNGFLVIMQADMSYIPFNNFPAQHVNRFYTQLPFYTGHFFIIKGYKRVDGNLFYEVYDPYTLGQRYTENGEIKGRNRYYSADAVRKGNLAQNGWKYAYVIHEKKGNGYFDGPVKNEISEKELAYISDPVHLQYAYGY